MSDISLSKAVRSNLLSLQNTASLMNQTQDRLATGMKVNSALDNPSNFFTAQSLNSRAGDLNALIDGMANGIQTLEAADNGLTAITKTLESMQSTLRQARQDKSFETQSFALSDIDPNDPDLGQLTFEGGSVGNPTSVDLFKTGSGQTSTFAAKYEAPEAAVKASFGVGTGFTAVTDTTVQAEVSFTIEFGDETLDITIAEDEADPAARTTTEFAALVQEKIAESALSDKIVFTEDATGKFKIESLETEDVTIGVSGDDAEALFGDPADTTAANQPVAVEGSDGQHSFTINGKEVVLDTTDGADLETAIAAINDQLGDDFKFEAFKELGGKIGLRATTADAGALTIGGDDAALFGAPASSTTLKFARSVDELVTEINTDLEGKIRASNDNGKLRIENLSTGDLTVKGTDPTSGAVTGGAGSAEIGGNTIRADLASQFNELRDQLDKLTDDASFNGVNLLRGDSLQLTFNETGTSAIEIQTKNGDTVNSSNLELFDIKAEDLDTDTNIDAELSKLKSALNEVRSQSSAFGSNLSVVQNRQDFTKDMINTLQTGAANLTLADMNEEAANLLALQTRQSLSSSSLSLASQADQSVLQLIR